MKKAPILTCGICVLVLTFPFIMKGQRAHTDSSSSGGRMVFTAAFAGWPRMEERHEDWLPENFIRDFSTSFNSDAGAGMRLKAELTFSGKWSAGISYEWYKLEAYGLKVERVNPVIYYLFFYVPETPIGDEVFIDQRVFHAGLTAGYAWKAHKRKNVVDVAFKSHFSLQYVKLEETERVHFKGRYNQSSSGIYDYESEQQQRNIVSEGVAAQVSLSAELYITRYLSFTLPELNVQFGLKSLQKDRYVYESESTEDHLIMSKVKYDFPRLAVLAGINLHL